MDATPFRGLEGAYSSGNGCIFLLVEMTIPNPGAGKDGRVAFTHNNVNENAGNLYYEDYSSSEWGQFGFGGTGICYCTAEVWADWNGFWAPWGSPL